MPRKRIRKTNRHLISEEAVAEAVNACLDGRMSIRIAATTFGLKKTTLQHRVEKARQSDLPAVAPIKYRFDSKYTHNQVFTKEQESQLKVYLVNCSKMQYGLSYKQVRHFAWQFAQALKIRYPPVWDLRQEAGEDWLKNFMSRNRELSLRKPENTSLSRATSFNLSNVNIFFNNFERALNKIKVTGDRIYNLDETGVTTVLETPKIIAQRGAKQVGQAVSAERGELVTFCAIICANGNTVPPVFVYPRTKFKDAFFFGAPPGSLGLANKIGSGWMNGKLFLEVCKHLQKHTKCTVEDPIILTLDNHESHCNLEVVMFCKENGICLVTFPPHCTHKMQPLDVGLYGPFKTFLKREFNCWMASNPGKTITIYNIAQLVNGAYMSAFTLKNITSAFVKTGLWPFSRSVFSEQDFLCSFVTDQPSPEERASTSRNESKLPYADVASIVMGPPTEPSVSMEKALERSEELMKSPEVVRPYPKYTPKATSTRGRKRGRSRILTETPEKNLIEIEHMERERKKNKMTVKKKVFEESSPKKGDSKVNDSDSEANYSVCDSDSDVISEFDKEKSDEEFLELVEPLVDPETGRRNLKVDDFILVKFSSKKIIKHFVGSVTDIFENDNYFVSFLRHKKGKFVYHVEDSSLVYLDDIVTKLPLPKNITGTARVQSSLSFAINLTSYML